MILGAVRTNFGSISASKPRNVSVKRAQITNRNVPVSYVAKRNFVLPARLTSSHPVSKQTVSLPKIHSNLSLNSSLLFKTVKVTTPTLRFGDLQVRYYSSNEEYPEHIVLEMPALSPTMNTGTIAKWLRKEGDKISSGTQIADIETDKATLAWESVDDGYLAKILLPDGTTDIAVGNAVAILAASEKDIPAFANYSVGGASTPAPASQTTQKEEPSTPAPTPASQTTSNAKQPSTPAPSSGRVFASPAAKATAAASGKDLQGIVGTGPNNRIIKADVLEFEPPTQVRATVPSSGANYTDIPNSKVRAITASRLTQSKQTIPHYYLTVDFSVDKLQKLRSELNSLSKDYKLSVNDFVIKATALALRDVPEVNSQWNDTSIRRFHDVHINVAVNTDNGLFTPILQFTDKLGLKSINKSVKELADKAHDAKLTPADLEIGTFTISNLGMYGIKNFSAVINPPQACILAVGGIEQRVVPSDKEGEFKISNYMSVTLSCDHRVVDGALGAVWLKSFKGYMENPMTLIL